MRRSYLSVLALTAVFIIVFSDSRSQADQSGIAAEVSAAEDKLLKAISEDDWSTALSLMTSDHVAVTPYLPGEADMKTVIEAVTAANFTYSFASDREVVKLGEGVALLKQEKLYKGKIDGVDLPPKVRLSAIWVKIDDVWKQRYYQETAVFEGP